MSFIRNLGATLTLVFIATACADTTEALKAVAAGEHRSAATEAREVWRHPVEAVQSVGIGDGVSVRGVGPGGGGSGVQFVRRSEQRLKD